MIVVIDGHTIRNVTQTFFFININNLLTSSQVLDMCAAPGSKTAQLIEAIHGDEKIEHPSMYIVKCT